MIQFRGASRHSLSVLRDQLRDLPADAGRLETAGVELFAVAGTLDAQAPLRRALTDPARRPDDRADLAASLLRSRIGETSLSLVLAAVRRSWSRVRDLADALEYLGVLALVRAAEAEGRLDDLEDDLFRFARLVEGDDQLLRALTDPKYPAERRAELVRTLLEGKAVKSAVRLVEQAVVAPRGLSLVEALDGFTRTTAAWRQRLVATVRSAVPLSEADRERLARVLSRRYGHDVDVNVLVDPGVIGGLRVELGDEVIDGTVAGRLEDARRRLAG